MSSAAFNIVEHEIEAAHLREYPRATAQSQDDKLLLHVKQYVPRDNPNPRRGDLTVVGAHANGFPKVGLPGVEWHERSEAHDTSDQLRSSTSRCGTISTARQSREGCGSAPSGLPMLLGKVGAPASTTGSWAMTVRLDATLALLLLTRLPQLRGWTTLGT